MVWKKNHMSCVWVIDLIFFGKKAEQRKVRIVSLRRNPICSGPSHSVEMNQSYHSLRRTSVSKPKQACGVSDSMIAGHKWTTCVSSSNLINVHSFFLTQVSSYNSSQPLILSLDHEVTAGCVFELLHLAIKNVFSCLQFAWSIACCVPTAVHLDSARAGKPTTPISWLLGRHPFLG